MLLSEAWIIKWEVSESGMGYFLEVIGGGGV